MLRSRAHNYPFKSAYGFQCVRGENFQVREFLSCSSVFLQGLCQILINAIHKIANKLVHNNVPCFKLEVRCFISMHSVAISINIIINQGIDFFNSKT